MATNIHKKKQKYKQLAEKYYQRALTTVIYPMVGRDTTWSPDLERAGKTLFGRKFRGVFTSDNLPKLKSGNMAIVNLDSSDEEGSHWIGVVKEKKTTLIYDSFGRKLHKIIPNAFKKYKSVQSTEMDKEQRESEEDCGARSLAFLYVYDKHGVEYAEWI